MYKKIIGLVCLCSFVTIFGCDVSENTHQLEEDLLLVSEEEVSSPTDSEEEELIEEIEEPPLFIKERIEFESLSTNIDYQLFQGSTRIEASEEQPTQLFDKTYTDVEGVLTFRGNHYRDRASFGFVSPTEQKLEIAWRIDTGHSPDWGGGAGWTGQPSIIKWDEETKQIMNLYENFKEKENFVEVVYGSLDGKIYFLDLETGEKTRPTINIQNPIKGSVAIDPRGYPLLYVGQGIPQIGTIGYRIFRLIDGEMLYFINGLDPVAYRQWGAFDGAAIINRETDTMFVGGENGVVYKSVLNTNYNPGEGTISVEPNTSKYRYKIDGNHHQGIENSVVAYKNLLFFADNGGSLQAIDTTNMKPRWSLPATDDTDATIVLEEEDHVPFLYTGTEVDNIGKNGDALLRKLNGLTGEEVWRKEIFAYFYDRVNGGLLATPVVGKNNLKDIVIFTLARTHAVYGGTMLALDKQSGEVIWEWEMPHYAWSSPVDVYTEEGEGFLLQADSVGNLYILSCETGEILNSINLGSNIEASPAVFNDTLVVATRGGSIYGVKIK